MRARLNAVAKDILAAYEKAGPSAASSVTPAMLVSALDVFFGDCERIDREYGPGSQVMGEDISTLSDQIFDCLYDLASWADRLGMRSVRVKVIDISLDVAQWCMRHGGQLRQIGPLVAALANRANLASSLEACTALADAYEAVIANVATRLQGDHLSKDPQRPWRQLLVNGAIVATRARDLRRMERAYRRLEAHLPSECPAFFERANHQVSGLGFSVEARALVRARLKRWSPEQPGGDGPS
jgi:hypothetical protein